VAFDIDLYSRLAGRLELDGLDLKEGFRDRPLPAGALRCLQYMSDIEHHTVCYLRDLLVTRAHEDPEVTTFLTIWNFEEHWHGDAIGQVLAAHGRPSGLPRVEDVRAHLKKGDKWRPVGFLLGSLVMPEMPAIHMVWGAINEWTTQAAYSLLLRKTDHPVLSELLRRIMKQEGRHVDFYSTQGRTRLERSRQAQRVTRWALKKYWKPVGHGVRPPEETEWIIRYLFASDQGFEAADRIDRNIDRLPGLDGLHLVRHAVEQYGPVAA
jgi:hypothetical protein